MMTTKGNDTYGLLIAVAIIGLWAGSLICLLSVRVSALHFLWIPPAVLWQTFLYTGLFITAHDAMHGTVLPQNRRLNNAIGTVAVTAYALFSYRKLLEKHRAHHLQPGTENDPDFHAEGHPGFLAWYLHFMGGYLSWPQLVGMAIAFNVLQYGMKVPAANLICFWMAPALLSTIQLFYFGTYLPHREPEENPHRARSNAYPVFWSFITCYHFGYHWEHHEHPNHPWWKLPSIRRSHQN